MIQRWTPNWSAILRDLPPTTHPRVRAAVEAARAAYFAVGDDAASVEQERLWRGIADYTGGRQAQGFYDLAARLPQDEALDLRSLISSLALLWQIIRGARFRIRFSVILDGLSA